MLRETLHALAACLVTFVLCAVAYPAVVWAMAQVAFPYQAAGSLIERRDRSVVGSELIGQPFSGKEYFHPRPSAAGTGYDASVPSGSNLAPTNPALRDAIRERSEGLGASARNPAPLDLVTASGSGLDPHISPEAARSQAARVAETRRLPLESILSLIERMTERSGGLIGALPRVNVLRLNLALDEGPSGP